MAPQNLATLVFGLPGSAVFIGPVVALFVLWSLVWKGLALWHSSRRGQPWWFVIMLIVNTAGILEIIYLFGVIKLGFNDLFTMGKHDAAPTTVTPV